MRQVRNASLFAQEVQTDAFAAIDRMQANVGFLKYRVPFWGGPHDKDYVVFGGLYWGPPIKGNYHILASEIKGPLQGFI